MVTSKKNRQGGFLYEEDCKTSDGERPCFGKGSYQVKNYINHAAIKLCIDENYRKDFIVKCSNRMKELLKDSANVKK